MDIAVFGGSFDPVGTHHLTIVKGLLEMQRFDQVLVLPCGPRPDKRTVDDINPVYRAALLDITFRNLSEQVQIDLDDLEKDSFTRAIDIERKLQKKGRIWHVVGYDLIEGGRFGDSAIQREWVEGQRLWETSRFMVIKRKGFKFVDQDLPPISVVLAPVVAGSSTRIRSRCFHHKPIDGLVVPEAQAYIERYSLYRGRLPLQQALCHVDEPRLLLVADENNPKARKMRKALETYSCPHHPNLIVDIGGDGNKLRAIRQYWRMRLPFFGINAGHRGYLLNDVDVTRLFPLSDDLVVHHLPLLHVDIKSDDGVWRSVLGFNEAWLERATGQSAWLEVIWNRQHRIPKVIGDGLLVSTAAGSTGYAKNIAGFSLPSHVRELLLVGMGIAEPVGWKNAIFSPRSIFEFRPLNIAKRPVRAFVDGIFQGNIAAMRVRASRIAAAELAFVQGHDIAGKHTKIQLPYFRSQDEYEHPNEKGSA
jgi:NAD+ kinase